MSCDCWLFPASLIIGIVTIFWIWPKLITALGFGPPRIRRSARERTYLDPKTGRTHLFPDLIHNETDKQLESASIYLSVIVPAYNEQDRLPKMLDEALQYLETRAEQNKRFTFEVIVVDDGSNDATSAVALEYSMRYGCDRVRLLRCDRNSGKGFAVRLGVLSSRGERILFADADGATKFSDIHLLDRFLDSVSCSDWAVAVGSRAHLQDKRLTKKNKSERDIGRDKADTANSFRQRSSHDQNKSEPECNETDLSSASPEAERSWFRLILMHGFHTIVYVCAVRSIRDTQCGFKMFGRKAAVKLFNSLHVTGWAFDVELLSFCEWLRLEVKEIPVNWTEIDGSKIVPIFSWMAMGRDVLKIAIMQKLGIWKRPLRN